MKTHTHKEVGLLTKIAKSKADRYIQQFDIPSSLYGSDMGWYRFKISEIHIISFPRLEEYKLELYKTRRKTIEERMALDYDKIARNVIQWLGTFDFQTRNVNFIRCHGHRANMPGHHMSMSLADLYTKDRYSKRFV